MKSGEVSRFVRKCILDKPDIEIEEVHRRWDAAKLPATERPSKQALFTCRYTIKQKYSVEKLSDLPRTPDGKIDPMGLLGIMCRAHKSLSLAQAQHWLSADGVEVTREMFEAAKKGQPMPQTTAPQPAPKAQSGALVPRPPDVTAEVVDDSPDPNQHKGPRARIVGKPGRKPKNPPEQAVEVVADEDNPYFQMEDALDDLVQRARELEDGPLTQRLRQVRREVIIKGLRQSE